MATTTTAEFVAFLRGRRVADGIVEWLSDPAHRLTDMGSVSYFLNRREDVQATILDQVTDRAGARPFHNSGGQMMLLTSIWCEAYEREKKRLEDLATGTSTNDLEECLPVGGYNLDVQTLSMAMFEFSMTALVRALVCASEERYQTWHALGTTAGPDPDTG